jgi:hypothetical protein
MAPLDPRQLATTLSRAYAAYYGAVRASVQPLVMGWIEIEVLDGIERLAASQPSSHLATLHQRLNDLLAHANALMNSEALRDEFKQAYREAEQIVFAAATAFVAHAQALSDWTRNFNLVVADVARLRALDLAAHRDPVFKTLDIVGGQLRHDAMMVDAIDQAVDLAEQVAEGRTVAVSEGEFAPYERYGENKTYDPRSLMRVIDTLREKFLQAFKAGQFAMGPTLALAVVDRAQRPRPAMRALALLSRPRARTVLFPVDHP